MQRTHTVGSQGEQAGGRTSTGGGTHSGRWAALPGACVPGLRPPLARGSEAGGVSAHPKLYTSHAHPGRTCRTSRCRGMDAPPSCGFLEQEWDDWWARPASWVVTKKKKGKLVESASSKLDSASSVAWAGSQGIPARRQGFWETPG